ncbi:unnamed protein product [Lampetra fluviatilis]
MRALRLLLAVAVSCCCCLLPSPVASARVPAEVETRRGGGGDAECGRVCPTYSNFRVIDIIRLLNHCAKEVQQKHGRSARSDASLVAPRKLDSNEELLSDILRELAKFWKLLSCVGEGEEKPCSFELCGLLKPMRDNACTHLACIGVASGELSWNMQSMDALRKLAKRYDALKKTCPLP